MFFFVEELSFDLCLLNSFSFEPLEGVRNVYAKGVNIFHTASALRIKTAVGRGGVVENITYVEVTFSLSTRMHAHPHTDRNTHTQRREIGVCVSECVC